MKARASEMDIGSAGGVVGSTPRRASSPSAATLFMVCRNRLICFLAGPAVLHHLVLAPGIVADHLEDPVEVHGDDSAPNSRRARRTSSVARGDRCPLRG
jgi:hypothetical protein